MIAKFLTWWNNATDIRHTPAQTGQLKEYSRAYRGRPVPPRYTWISARLGTRRIFRSPSESYACTECGCEVSRTLNFDGIAVHEDWHWRVGHVLLPRDA